MVLVKIAAVEIVPGPLPLFAGNRKLPMTASSGNNTAASVSCTVWVSIAYK